MGSGIGFETGKVKLLWVSLSTVAVFFFATRVKTNTVPFFKNSTEVFQAQKKNGQKLTLPTSLT